MLRTNYEMFHFCRWLRVTLAYLLGQHLLKFSIHWLPLPNLLQYSGHVRATTFTVIYELILHIVSVRKQDTWFLIITWANVNQFSEFFYWQRKDYQENFYNSIIKSLPFTFPHVMTTNQMSCFLKDTMCTNDSEEAFSLLVWCVMFGCCRWFSDRCHTCNFIARFCRTTLSRDKVAVCNCACRTLQLCRINKHWPKTASTAFSRQSCTK